MNYLGDFSQDSTIYLYLTTNDSSGGTVAPSGGSFTASDFFIHKNGSAVQKSTTNGITVVSPFDSVTGVHSLTIDTSNDTGDTGFWNSGCDYSVIASPSGTVDSQIVASIVGTFSIQNRSVQSALNELTTSMTSNKEEVLGSGQATTSALSDQLSTINSINPMEAF